MPVNWNIATGNNALNMFQYGAQLGQQVRERRDAAEQKNALTAYATDPNAPGAFEGLAKANPGMAIQARGQQQQAAQQQQEQRRADLPTITRLLEYSTDEGTYQQARATAQQIGIDTSTLPANFDPNWRNQQLGTLRAIGSPQGQQALSDAGKQAVDAGFQPGTPQFNQAVQQLVQARLAQPYTGSQGETRVYTPSVWGQQAQQPQAPTQAPQPGMVEDGYRFKGGNPADPNAWEPVSQGGPASAPGTFRP